MAEKESKILQYGSLGTGILCMALLRIFDESSIVSMLLISVELIAFIWNTRHTQIKKQKLLTAVALVIAYCFHVLGYTQSAWDFTIGIEAGLVMFALLRAERLFKKYEDNPLYCLITPVVFYLFMLIADIMRINIAFRLDSYFASFTELVQIAGILGIYFIDFIIVLLASVIVYILDHGFSKRGIIVAIAYILILSGIFIYGVADLNRKEKASEAKTDSIRIAYATGPYYGDFVEACDADTSLEQAKESLHKTLMAAASDDADVLVLNEEAYCTADYEEDELLNYASGLAKEKGIHILLPYEIEDTDNSGNGKGFNQLCWIDDKGEIIYQYVKHCLIPIVETTMYIKGDRQASSFDINVDNKEITVAAVICYDSDFDIYMNQVGKDIDVLFVPSWDWKVIRNQHLNISSLLAVSLNTTLVRSVYDGWSAVIDCSGNVLTKTNSNDIGYETVVTYDVPIL